MLLHEYLQRCANLHPEKIGLVTREARYSYGDLFRTANGLASYLVENGLRKNDRVAIYLENGFETVVSIFGALRAGGCFVIVNPSAPPERLGFILDHSGARFLVASFAKAARIRTILQTFQNPPQTIFAGSNPDITGTSSLLSNLMPTTFG